MPYFPNTSSNNVDPSEFQAPHTEYSLTTYYFDSSGLVMMPVCGPPGTPAQFCNWEAPAQTKVVMWTATRIKLWPVLPDPTPANSNEVYMDYRFYQGVPAFLPDGVTQVFTCGGIYFYGLIVPAPLDQLLNNFAKVPFDNGTPPGITLSQFKQLFPAVAPPPIGPGARLPVI